MRRCSGRTGTRVGRGAAVALGVHSSYDGWEQGNDHHREMELAGMLMYENNLRNIIASAAVSNAKACLDITVIIELLWHGAVQIEKARAAETLR